MIRFLPEGEELKLGINFYPLNDPLSAGFRLFIPDVYKLRVRYSKKLREWFIDSIWVRDCK